MALCTQQDIEKVLQITFGSTPEPVADFLIEGAEELIKKYLGRDVLEAATGIIETHDGPDASDSIRLWEWPVTGITSITEAGTALTVADDVFWYENGQLFRKSGDYTTFWTGKRQSIVVTYDAGYASVPFPLRDACAHIAARGFTVGAEFANDPMTGLKSQTLGEWSESYHHFDHNKAMVGMGLTPDDKLALATFRSRAYA